MEGALGYQNNKKSSYKHMNYLILFSNFFCIAIILSLDGLCEQI